MMEIQDFFLYIKNKFNRIIAQLSPDSNPTLGLASFIIFPLNIQPTKQLNSTYF